MEYATLLVLVGCIAVGVVSAVVKTWSLRASLYSLEDRVALIEGAVTRETKARAAQERWKKPDKTDALAQELLGSHAPVTRQQNWWERPDLPKSSNVT